MYLINPGAAGKLSPKNSKRFLFSVQLLKDATESRHKCELMKEQEHQLKQQLTLYMDKFEEFQTTLAKSNEVFTTFRQEMEKVSVQEVFNRSLSCSPRRHLFDQKYSNIVQYYKFFILMHLKFSFIPVMQS